MTTPLHFYIFQKITSSEGGGGYFPENDVKRGGGERGGGVFGDFGFRRWARHGRKVMKNVENSQRVYNNVQ